MSDSPLTRREVNLCQGLLHCDVLSVSFVMKITDLSERQVMRLLSKLERNGILNRKENGGYAFTRDGKPMLVYMYVYGLPKSTTKSSGSLVRRKHITGHTMSH